MRILSLILFFTIAISGKALSNCVYGDCLKGYGTFKWSNGESYEGEFKLGKRHGEGTYKFTNGKVVKGNWRSNKFID